MFAQRSIQVAKVNEMTLILDRSTLTFLQVEFITKLFFFHHLPLAVGASCRLEDFICAKNQSK
jgi:hypothetical protein